MSWRDIAKKVIAKAMEEVGPDFDKISRNYYPFGDRKYHPYHIWLDEIARQRKEHQPQKDERKIELFPGGSPEYIIEALRKRLETAENVCRAAEALKLSGWDNKDDYIMPIDKALAKWKERNDE